jgi:hypothetical protein
MYAEMVDKEQQISESNQMYGQLQTQLEVMLDTIAKETDDIKKLDSIQHYVIKFVSDLWQVGSFLWVL